MRIFARMVALVVVPLVLLVACNKKADAAPTGYDLTPASNAKYLADYAAKPGVKKTEDGLLYRVIRAGTGTVVQKNSDVATVFYKGALITGKVFDQQTTDPIQLPVGGVVPGWTEALKLMKTGDVWEIVLPAELGYGSEGFGDTIPPDQVLVFQLQLVKVEYAP
jgi:FKBP-type peptidyl-prolyl cis-trans isomerase FklB